MHHARPARLDDAGHLRQLVSDLQTPDYVAIRYEMIHETRIIPLDGRPHVEFQGAHPHGRRARPLGRRHPRRRNDELSGESLLTVESNAATLRMTESFTRVGPKTVKWAGDA